MSRPSRLALVLVAAGVLARLLRGPSSPGPMFPDPRGPVPTRGPLLAA